MQLRSGPHDVWKRLRQRAERQLQLRGLRHGVHARHDLSGRFVPVRQRGHEVQRPVHSHAERPEQLRRLRARVRRGRGMRAGELQLNMRRGGRSAGRGLRPVDLRRLVRRSDERSRQLRCLQHALSGGRQLRRQPMRLRSQRHALWHVVLGHADRPAKLRRLRQRMPRRLNVCRGCLRGRVQHRRGPEHVRERVRQRSQQQPQLRRLRHRVPCRRPLPRWNVSVRGRLHAVRGRPNGTRRVRRSPLEQCRLRRLRQSLPGYRSNLQCRDVRRPVRRERVVALRRLVRRSDLEQGKLRALFRCLRRQSRVPKLAVHLSGRHGQLHRHLLGPLEQQRQLRHMRDAMPRGHGVRGRIVSVAH